MPMALGEPGLGYPLPWSIQSWIPGRDGIDEDPAGSASFVHDLASLIGSLRAAETGGRATS